MTEVAPVLAGLDLVAGYSPEVDILRGVTVAVSPGEIVTVVGPNGAGKSTLLKAIVGLVGLKRGAIRLAGRDIAGLRPNEVVGRGLGYVPQRDNVFPSLTVEENLDMGLTPRRDLDGPARLAHVQALFPRLAERRRQVAGNLSGGERQMLAMARALMPDPRVLLLDEPTAGLAPRFVEAMFEQVVSINRAGVTILMVEQNAARALAISHRGYVLDLGRNAFEGEGPTMLKDPKIAALYLGAAMVDMTTAPALDFEALDTLIVSAPYHRWLGVRLKTLAPTHIEVTLPWREEFVSHPEIRYTHGGILAALVDLAADYAIAARLGRGVPTVDLRTDYHKAALPGPLVARAEVIRLGRTLATAEARVYDAAGDLIASGRGVYVTATR